MYDLEFTVDELEEMRENDLICIGSYVQEDANNPRRY